MAVSVGRYAEPKPDTRRKQSFARHTPPRATNRRRFRERLSPLIRQPSKVVQDFGGCRNEAPLLRLSDPFKELVIVGFRPILQVLRQFSARRCQYETHNTPVAAHTPPPHEPQCHQPGHHSTYPRRTHRERLGNLGNRPLLRRKQPSQDGDFHWGELMRIPHIRSSLCHNIRQAGN